MFQLQKKNLQKKNRRVMLAVCILMLTVTAGCGEQEEGLQIKTIGDARENTGSETGNSAETEDEDGAGEDAGGGAAENDEDTEENENAGDIFGEESDPARADKDQGSGQDSGQDSALQSVGNTEITGNVTSLSADSFVICKSETWSEDGAECMVSVAPGYEEEEDLVTIQVAGNCTYSYKTVKNGGVSPEDVSTREGSFTDLKEEMSVTLKGSWQADGSFIADSVVMSVFV